MNEWMNERTNEWTTFSRGDIFHLCYLNIEAYVKTSLRYTISVFKWTILNVFILDKQADIFATLTDLAMETFCSTIFTAADMN